MNNTESSLMAQVLISSDENKAADFFNTFAAMTYQLRNVYEVMPCQELWQMRMVKHLTPKGKQWIRELNKEIDNLES